MSPLVLAAASLEARDVTDASVSLWRDVLRALAQAVSVGCDELHRAGMPAARLGPALGWVRVAQLELGAAPEPRTVESLVRQGYVMLLRVTRTQRKVPTCSVPAERLLRRLGEQC